MLFVIVPYRYQSLLIVIIDFLLLTSSFYMIINEERYLYECTLQINVTC